MRGAAHRVLHDEALRLGAQFVGRARHSGHPACQKLSPRRAARHFSAGEWRSPTIFWRGVGKRRESPLPRWQAFLQASVVPTLAGGCLGKPTWGPRYVRSVSTHPTLATRCFLRAKWSLLARLRAGVFTCKVFLRCRDTRSAWRDDFRRLAEVRCRKVIRSDLARLFCTDLLHFRRCCLRARWSLHTRVHALDVFFRALGVFLCKVFLRCRDTRSAWRDDFCQLAWGAVQSSDSTWSGSTFFAPPSCAPAVAVSVVYPSLLQPRWFT